MSIWLILWLLLSAALIYFFGWTLFILFRQKQVWRDYAIKKKLRYRAKAALGSPELGGTFGGYTISLFTGEHVTADARSTRKLTAVEVQLPGKMPFAGGVGSGDMVKVIQQFGFKEEIRPEHADWRDNYIASAESAGVIRAYLTRERLDVLTALMKMKNAWVIMVFRDNTSLLRFDTPDPLDTEKKLDFILKKMTDAAKILEITDNEAAILKSEAVRKSPKEVSLDVKTEDLEKPVGFELEDDRG